MQVQDFEKIGVFYLGKKVNSKTGKLTDDLVLYESKNLTTHAVCVGMTGSGKTGLGITILEEAAMDKIPAIIIDPKGDLADLILTFPDLSPEEFLPWIDEADAQRKGETPEEYAAEVSKTWSDGLAEWGEGPERIKNLRKNVDIVIYTPASNAGIPISILSSFAAPPKELLMDPTAIRDRVSSLTSSILGLLGINADPLKSREHIVISTIIDQSWQQGKDLDITTLIQQIQRPPFQKIGALDIDTFFPQKDRMALSISLNNLLASPGFKAWMEGEPLDIKSLLHTKEGKPKLSVMSIAHLSDSERMFFVTLLLNEMLTWMRRQPGTSSLRALLYMDEIFGYFPPSAAPPSKLPMLTLLKQARAFGLGVVLCTQNPVDLDYKGLSNCGTWFIGKLQTERDKARVCEGLKIASNGEIDADTLDKLLGTIAKRTFIMRSIYEKEPIVFTTRWTMSYLRGPLTLSQISSLVEKPADLPKAVAQAAQKMDLDFSKAKPVIPPEISEFFVRKPNAQQIIYKPQVLGIAKLHFTDTKSKIDSWQDIYWLAPPDDDGKSVLWEEGKNYSDIKPYLDKSAAPGSSFAQLPTGLMQPKNYSAFNKAFAAFLYQNQVINIFHASEFGMTSNDGENEGDFKTRLTLAIREKRDEMLKKVNDKYSEKIATLNSKIRRCQDKVVQTQQKSIWSKINAFISFGTAILGAIFGKGVTKGTITQTGTSIRRAARITRDSQDAAAAEEDCNHIQQQLDDLRSQQQQELDRIAATEDVNNVKIDTITIRPRKSDMSIDNVALVWLPMK